MSSDFRFDPLEVRGSGQRIIEIAGVNLANRQLVRYNAVGQLVLADASALATLPCIGITLATASAGQQIEILLKGFLGLSTWAWTPGSMLYVSNVAGALGALAGTTAQRVAVVNTATQIWFDPKGLDTGVGGPVCALLEGNTAYVGFDVCKGTNYTNYWTLDGTADDVQLQLAVDYVQALGGGSVMCEAGLYDITAAVSLPGSLHLIGQIPAYATHTGTRFRLANAANCVMIDTKAEEGGLSNYITLENIWFYGNGGNQVGAWDIIDFTNARRSYVERCRIASASNYGFTGRAVIYKCEFAACDYAAIYAATDCVIDSCHIAGNVAGVAHDAGPSAQIISAAGANKIISNHIHTSPYGSGIASSGVRDIIIGNTITLNEWYGIYATGNEILISDNIVYNNSQRGVGSVHGIYITNSDLNTITDNRCYDDQGTETQDSGIFLNNADDNLITDNFCWGNTNYGINISTATCDRNVVKDNRLLNNGVAAFNDAGTDTAVHELFAPVSDPNATKGRHPAVDMPEDTDTNIYAQLLLPLEFQELVTCSVIVVSAASGNMVWTVNTDYGKICSGEDYNAHSDSRDVTSALVIDDLECLGISDALNTPAIAGGDLIGIDFMRDGDDVADDIEDSVFYMGIRLRYV